MSNAANEKEANVDTKNLFLIGSILGVTAYFDAPSYATVHYYYINPKESKFYKQEVQCNFDFGKSSRLIGIIQSEGKIYETTVDDVARVLSKKKNLLGMSILPTKQSLFPC